MDLFRLIVVVVVGAANLGLALAVYLRNTRSPANRALAAAVMMIVCWLGLGFLSDQPAFSSLALPLNRADFAAGIAMGALLIYFVILFPKRTGPLAWHWKGLFASGIVMAALTVLTDLVVRDVDFQGSRTDIVAGPLFAALAVLLVMGVLLIVVTMAEKYRGATGRERAQLKYMLFGVALFVVVSVILGLIVPMLTGAYEFANLTSASTLFFVGFTTYAMVKHRLMDIRLVVLRGATYTVLVAITALILVVPVVAVRAGLTATLGINADLMFVLAGLVAVLAFQPLKSLLERTTDGFLHRMTYDPDQLLGRLGTAMSTTLDARVLASLLSHELADAMKLDFTAVAYLHCDAPESMSVGGALSDGDTRRLLSLSRDGSILVADDLEQGSDAAFALADCGIRVIAPLSMDGSVLGAIMLGAKRSGGMFTDQDLRFLEILSPEASIAMNNAHVFDEKNLRVRELTALNELAYALGANIELESVLDAAMEQVVAVTNADSGSIMLLDEDKQTLSISVSRGIPERIVGDTKIALGEGIAGWVASTREALILVDDTDPRFRDDLHRNEIVSAISAPVICKDSVIGVINVNRRRSAELFTRENLNVVSSFAGQMAVVIENARLYRDLENTILGTIGALAAAVDAKDPYTFGHSNDVTEYAIAIAAKLGFGESEVQTVRIAATLHDIGKIGIDGAILNKPGKLTEEEWAAMCRHPAIGADILAPLDFLREAVPSILFHHERYGGGGYPSGISGEAIPIGARIISVADSYNAMVSDRPYRTAMARDRAVQELLDNSGTQFDPIVVRAMLDILAQEKPAAQPVLVSVPAKRNAG